MSFVLSVVSLLMQWYVWMPIVLVLGYMTWRNYRSIDAVKNIESVLLMLEIPKTNDKSELAAEQMFASLHGILRDARELRANGGFDCRCGVGASNFGHIVSPASASPEAFIVLG